MSQEAPVWFVEKYKSHALHVFQSKGHVLRGTCMPPTKIDGKTMYFPIAGMGEAVEMTVGSKAKPMNAPRTNKSLQSKPYQATEWINETDLNKMSVNEVQVAQETAGNALGRKCDRVQYDAIDGGLGTYGTAYGSGTVAWDLKLALAAVTGHFDKDIPEDGLSYCMVPQLVFSQMMSYSVFSSSDWVGVDLPFAKVRRAKAWGGVNWFTGPKSLFKQSGVDMRFFIWHRNAVGCGYNGAEMNTKITWENQETAWFANNWMDIGATVLLPEGITECHFKSDSLITGGTI